MRRCWVVAVCLDTFLKGGVRSGVLGEHRVCGLLWLRVAEGRAEELIGL